MLHILDGPNLNLFIAVHAEPPRSRLPISPLHSDGPYLRIAKRLLLASSDVLAVSNVGYAKDSLLIDDARASPTLEEETRCASPANLALTLCTGECTSNHRDCDSRP